MTKRKTRAATCSVGSSAIALPKERLPPRAFRRSATGSGFIVDKNGYILTNNHVIEKADSIKVKIPNDQDEYRAKLIGYDLETDLAVIKIDSKKPLTAGARRQFGRGPSGRLGDRDWIPVRSRGDRNGRNCECDGA